MSYVLRCDHGDMLPTGECAAPYFGQDVGIFPPLEVADAWQIAAAIGALWAMAWVIRMLRRFLESRVGI